MERTEILLILLLALCATIVVVLILVILRLLALDKRNQALYEKLLGSSTKGQLGEAAIASILKPFIDAQLVVTDLPVEGLNRRVEFAVEVEEGNYCPIDQKTSGKARQDIDDVAHKYMGKPNTTFFAVLTVPEHLFVQYLKLRDYALQKGIIIVKNTDLVYAIPLILRLYRKFRQSGDVKSVQNLLARYQSIKAEMEKVFYSLNRQYLQFRQSFEEFLSI
ncbi:MAG: hypothetical protein JW969_15465 [Spirochaetales bacterium]|nr:hypothetical protein [Spirochaetales bacterium]